MKYCLSVLLLSVAFLSAAQTGRTLADSLRYVDDMPYICEDNTKSEVGCGNAVFWRVVQQKQMVIPDLINMLTDTTQTAATVPNFGGQYAAGDVAYAALKEIIHGVPTFKLLGVKFDNNGCGYCAYWNHVRMDIRNRKKFQDKVRDWYDKNKTNLTWINSNDFSICDCASPHPNGGHFELKE